MAHFKKHLQITGTDADETFTGYFGSERSPAWNEINGGGGNDTIYAGGGIAQDDLTGGAGADTFVWGSWAWSSPDDQRDTIFDFEAVDTIALLWMNPVGAASHVVITEVAPGEALVEVDPGTDWEFEIQVLGVTPTIEQFTFGTA